jgi:hypothetical protein
MVGAKPSSIEDAVSAILAAFPEAELQSWARQSEDEACVQAHLSLGAWIRNNWVYGDGSPLVTKIREAAVLIHDDDISLVIVRGVWRLLNGVPGVSIEELLDRRKAQPARVSGIGK